MTYKLYTHDQLPAIFCELGADFSLRDDMENVLGSLQDLLDKADQPLYYINDLTGARLSFGDIVLGMGMAASAGGVLRHPNLREMIIISASDVIKLGVKALGQAQYGGINARIATDMDQAVAFVQGEGSKV